MRDWDEHRLILALHRHGTLRATGHALGVTHTTIARRLTLIQAKESAPLFTRQSRSYVATEYGLERVALATQIEGLDNKATRLQRRSADGLSGPLSLSIPQAVLRYLLLDDIGAFTSAHPDIALTVVSTDRLADLDRGEADVVVRGQANPPDHLVGRQICSVGLGLYARERYLEETAVADRRWIVSKSDADWIQDTPFPDYPVGLVVHDIQSCFLAMQNGQGIARGACFMGGSHKDVVRLDDGPSRPLYGLWVLTHPDLRGSEKVRTLMRAMSDGLSRQRQLIEG